jgi:outer membrane lipoprotein-sorting protein
MLSRIQSTHSFVVNIKTSTQLIPGNGGKPITVYGVEIVKFVRPNLISLDIQQGGGIKVVSDGNKLYEYSELENEYSVSPAPASLSSHAMGALPPASDMHDVGTGIVNGVSVTEFSGTVSTSHGDMQVTVSVGTRDALPHRSVFVRSQLPGASGNNFKMVVTQDYANEQVNVPIGKDVFRFSPPAGASKVQSVRGAMGLSDLGGL